jgi:hypothetical protein
MADRYAMANRHSGSYLYGYTHEYENAYPDGYTYRHAQGYSDSNADGHQDAALGDAHACASDPDRDSSGPNADPNAFGSNTDADTPAQPYSHRDGESVHFSPGGRYLCRPISTEQELG